MQTQSVRSKAMYILIGALATLGMLLVSGAGGGGGGVGRYQMETLVRNNSTQIYVMDTATGAVKWVDAMDRPFTEMKGE